MGRGNSERCHSLALSALFISLILGAATAPTVNGARRTPPGETNGPLAYQVGGVGRIAITTIGSAEKTAAGAQSAVPTKFPLRGSAPAWSASGLRLAFSRSVAGRRQLFVADGDGTNVRQLTNEPADASDPSWAPDGTQLAFTSTRNGRRDIYAIGIQGKGKSRLLTNDPVDAFQSDWSPDGKEIAFVSRRTGNSDIWRMNADGSRQLPVTTSPARELDPDWRDNRTLAFSGRTPTGASIFMIDRDGSRLSQLTDSAVVDRYPSWSPIGDRIAFTRTSGDDRSTWVISTGTSALQDPRKEIPGAIRAHWGALPQPPSNQLALGETMAAVTPEHGDVTLTPPDSGNQTPLAENGARVPLGYVVHAPGKSEVTVKANVASAQADSTAAQDAPLQQVEATVSGTFELVPPDEDDSAAVTLRLRGSGPDCSKQDGTSRARGASSSKRRRTKRVLRTRAKGRVKHVARGVRGSSKATEWVTEESCTGTLTRVLEGVVSVEDRGLGITVDVAAGQKYLARRVDP